MSKTVQYATFALNILFYIIVRKLTHHNKLDVDITNSLILATSEPSENSENSSLNIDLSDSKHKYSGCVIRHYSGSPSSHMMINITVPIVNTESNRIKPRQKDYEKFFKRSLKKFDPRSFEFGDYEAEISSKYNLSTPESKIPFTFCRDDNECRKTQLPLEFSNPNLPPKIDVWPSASTESKAFLKSNTNIQVYIKSANSVKIKSTLL